MQVTLDIPDEVAAQAEARGVPVESYIRGILEQAAAIPSPAPTQSDPPGPPRRKRTREELHAFFEEFAQFSDQIPDLAGMTFDREMVYPDHD
jgi:hypothetical protein